MLNILSDRQSFLRIAAGDQAKEKCGKKNRIKIRLHINNFLVKHQIFFL
jgi:hypothetical protein